MAVTTSQSTTDKITMESQPWEKVATCYSAVDKFFPACRMFDLTEGIYHSNANMPYEQAEANQLDYLLSQVGCEPGRRALDLGCGYGTLLERIRQRCAKGVGITKFLTMMSNSCRYIKKLLTNHLLLPGSATLIALSFDY